MITTLPLANRDWGGDTWVLLRLPAHRPEADEKCSTTFLPNLGRLRVEGEHPRRMGVGHPNVPARRRCKLRPIVLGALSPRTLILKTKGRH